MKNTRKLVFISLLVTQAMVLNYIERPLEIGIPGAKLGLANIITLISLYTLDLKTTLVIIFARTTLSAAMFGNFTGYIFALSGGLVSFFVMALLIKFFNKKISLIFLSIMGAMSHNIGQLATAALSVENYKIIIYLPVLILVAIPTGLFVGICSKGLLSYLYRTDLFFKEKN